MLFMLLGMYFLEGKKNSYCPTSRVEGGEESQRAVGEGFGGIEKCQEELKYVQLIISVSNIL